MPKREVLKSIILARGKPEEVPGEKDGRGRPLMVSPRIELTVGQVFDFTDEELRQIEKTDPSAVSKNTTVDLSASDSDDVDPAKVDSVLTGNQQSGPALMQDADDSL
jgi:hypothetical protein